jgi:hypothetical protein
VVLTHLFVLSNDEQAGLELAVAEASKVVMAVVATAVRNGSKFSQCIVVWGGFHRLGAQGVEGLILVSASFPLDRGRRREAKKKEKKKERKIAIGKGGSLGLDPPY